MEEVRMQAYQPTGDRLTDAFAEAYISAYNVLVQDVRRRRGVPTARELIGFHDIAMARATKAVTTRGHKVTDSAALADHCWAYVARKYGAPATR
jgi:hypothetical protein